MSGADEAMIRAVLHRCHQNQTGNGSLYMVQYHCSKVVIDQAGCHLLQSRADMDTIRSLCEASDVIWHAIFWFAMVTGVVGNCLSIATVASLPTSTATFYIGLLALSDLAAILVRLALYFLVEHRLLNPRTAYWHLFPLLFDFTASYSNWLLVLICLERLITIRYPFQKRYYFTIPCARLAAIVVGVVLFVAYNAAAWNLGYADLRMYTVRNLLYAVIPLFLILVLIALIGINLRIIHRNRKTLQERTAYINAAGSSSAGNTDANPATAITTNTTTSAHSEATPLGKRQCSSSTLFTETARMENSITIMMMVAAVCFALLTLPFCVQMFIYRHATEVWNTPLARARWHVFTKTALALPFVNLAINFFLYFLSTKKFRTQLCKVLRLKGRQTPESTSLPLNTHSVNYSVTDNNCLL